MSKSFWQKLKKPIIALAPMANVTDAAFRRIIAAASKPDVMWTEFVSVEALLSKGRDHALIDFWFTEKERPVVAQIFGAKPEQFEQVAILIKELGFDGIDINMGCPDRGVEKQGAGAALIKNPKLAKEIIQATKRGGGGLPVSVKTRIGYNKEEIATWIPTLLEEDLAALTAHLRIRKEMSDVPAHWEVVNQVVQLRNKIAPQTLILGNGDIKTLCEAHEMVQKTSVDGIMIGRGIFGNPWVFSDYQPTIKEKLDRMVEHTDLFEQLFKSNGTRNDQLKDFALMRKHYKAYVSGFDGAKELRVQLMEAKDTEAIRKTVKNFLDTAPTAWGLP